MKPFNSSVWIGSVVLLRCATDFSVKVNFFLLALLPILVIGGRALAGEYFYSDECPGPISSDAGKGVCKVVPGYKVLVSPNGQLTGCPKDMRAAIHTRSATICYSGRDKRPYLNEKDTYDGMMNLFDQNLLDHFRVK